MRCFALAFLVFSSACAWADGALFPTLAWRSANGASLTYPGAPAGGRAPQDAVRIAVIDSGVAVRHPQLEGYVLDSADFTGEGPDDVHGHGTAVALVAVFGSRAAQPEVGILSAKVADRAGRVREADLMRAIDWAAARGANIVYLSLGFQGTRRQHRELCDTIARHWRVLFFASAGNFPRPTEVYPANCRLGNLHPTWVDPRTPPGELAIHQVLR
jgi:subtilisin family serine protease